jgi:uncharacterized protein YdaU (DUF1376 family)
MNKYDITRFTFHAQKFYFSESVRAMSAEEVGQYLLLLVASWLGGKEASLPDNPGMMAREARVREVSPLVLEMFPLVETEEHGSRRRNETLHQEWLNCREKTDVARTNGSQKTEAKAVAARENGRLGGRPRVLTVTDNRTETEQEPNGNQTETDLTEQNRTEQNRTEQNKGECSVFDSVSQEQSTGDWKSIAIRHKRIFGKKAATQFRIKYADACLKYGETIVLECFDSWAPGALDWVRREGVDQPLFSFFKKMPQEAEEAVELAEALKEDDQRLAQQQQATADREKQAAAVQADSIERQTQEIIARRDARPQVSEVSMEDFLEAK